MGGVVELRVDGRFVVDMFEFRNEYKSFCGVWILDRMSFYLEYLIKAYNKFEDII